MTRTEMDALLTQNDRMEALSRVYVSAIAARAGYTVGHAVPDRDSVDLFLNAGGAMRPQIGVQLKATTKIPQDAADFSFPLPIKNYDDLRIATQSPRILIILALPADDGDWLTHSINQLILKRCAYWTSLAGMPETRNTTTISISIDMTRVFDVPTLASLMEKSRNGQPL